MHEMGITQSILAASFDAANDAGATRITEIRISVGELTETVDFALQFAFEALTPDTIAEGAMLVINKVPARSHCRDCGTDYGHDRFQMVCSACGSMNVELLQGRELKIDSIEADDGEDDPPAAGRARLRRVRTHEGVAVEIDLSKPILDLNERLASENRSLLDEHGVFVLDLMASPGAGKTSTILATIAALRDRYRIAVIEGDIASQGRRREGQGARHPRRADQHRRRLPPRERHDQACDRCASA